MSPIRQTSRSQIGHKMIDCSHPAEKLTLTAKIAVRRNSGIRKQIAPATRRTVGEKGDTPEHLGEVGESDPPTLPIRIPTTGATPEAL